MWLPATSSTRLWTDVGCVLHTTAPNCTWISLGRDAALRKVVSQGISAWLMTHQFLPIKYCMLCLWKPHFQILSTLHKAKHIMPTTLKHTWQEVSAAVAGIQAIAGRQSSNLPERSSYARHFSEFQLGLGSLLITPGSCSYILTPHLCPWDHAVSDRWQVPRKLCDFPSSV